MITCTVLRSASQILHSTVSAAHCHIYHADFRWTRRRTPVKWAPTGHQFYWPSRAILRYELCECPPSDRTYWQYGVRRPTSSGDSECSFTVLQVMAPLLTAISPKVLAQQGNQSQLQLDGRRTPGNTQHVPIAPGPPWLEQYAPAFPVRPPPLSSRARTAFLTPPLATGSTQRPPPQPRSSSSQRSRAVSRKSQPCKSWNSSGRRAQKSRGSLPPQPWLTC